MTDAEDVVCKVRDVGIEAHSVAGYGWPGQIELALVDSVMSIRARYGTETSGVLGRVLRYRSSTERRPLDDLSEFARLDPEELRDLLGSQRSGVRLKSEVCLEVAQRLVDAGVAKSSDLEASSSTQKRAWTGTVGLGWITWEYFTMLLGHPGVKADTMINVSSPMRSEWLQSTRRELTRQSLVPPRSWMSNLKTLTMRSGGTRADARSAAEARRPHARAQAAEWARSG